MRLRKKSICCVALHCNHEGHEEHEEKNKNLLGYALPDRHECQLRQAAKLSSS
jgi:hypothetical protein